MFFPSPLFASPCEGWLAENIPVVRFVKVAKVEWQETLLSENQYWEVMGVPPSQYGSRPMLGLTLARIQEFLDRLNQIPSAYRYRLPHASELERLFEIEFFNAANTEIASCMNGGLGPRFGLRDLLSEHSHLALPDDVANLASLSRGLYSEYYRLRIVGFRPLDARGLIGQSKVIQSLKSYERVRAFYRNDLIDSFTHTFGVASLAETSIGDIAIRLVRELY